MRVAGILASVLGILVGAVLLAWWLPVTILRLAVRWGERHEPLRSGAGGSAAFLVVAAVLVLAAVLGIPAGLLRWVGVDWADLFGTTTPWLVSASARLLCAAWVIAAVAGCLQCVLGALGEAKRRGHLLLAAAGAPAAPAGDARGRAPGRAIVILCDGTGNRPDLTEDGEPATTNVHKLYRRLVSDALQSTWYEAGVGSDSSRAAGQARASQRVLEAAGAKTGARVATFVQRLIKVVEGATGSGISETIINGYAEIVRQYRPGDRIFLVGFSRGAFAARCIAGVIARGGVLRAENLRYAPAMVQLYRSRPSPDALMAINQDMVHADPRIEVLGVFDTVGSLGAPLWGWWFRLSAIWKNRAFATDPAPVCAHVYHALAMDERRSQFFPTLFSPGKDPRQVLEQVWFRGAHADIGGGYARTGLSDITLAWMQERLLRNGLRLRPDAPPLQPDPLAPIHDELASQPNWRLFGSWPRWHPVPGGTCPQGSVLADSVAVRTNAIHSATCRHDMRRLAPGESIMLVAEGLDAWQRTGLVIEHGADYEIVYEGGEWRDAEQRPCGPEGQAGGGLGDPVRPLLWWGKRINHAPWLQLMATVAHPRVWPVLEFGLWPLVKLMVHNDPPALHRQIAAIGEDLGHTGKRMFIRNAAPSGLLYLFANDWWQTAANNSGGIALRISRVGALPETHALWTLRADGEWSVTRVGTAPEASPA